MSRYCHSCTMPLDMPGAQGPNKSFCTHCTDSEGKLKNREEIRQGIAHWMQSWQGSISRDTALRRADHFMKAMPAWAEEK